MKLEDIDKWRNGYGIYSWTRQKSSKYSVIDTYVNSLKLSELGFIEYSESNRGQVPYRRIDGTKIRAQNSRHNLSSDYSSYTTLYFYCFDQIFSLYSGLSNSYSSLCGNTHT